MSKSNKLLQGIVLGALAGGLISLLHKETRETTWENCQRQSEHVKAIIKDPHIVVDRVKEATDKIRASIDQMTEDIYFINDQVSELKEVSPQLAELLERKSK